MASLQALTPDEQRQVDEWGRESRALERQAQIEATTNKNAAEAARTLRERHMERASPLMDDANARYQLTNLQPGPAERAMRVKRDPAFPFLK